MEKKFFDWEDDSELSTDSNFVRIPLSAKQKAEQNFQDHFDGYRYTKYGMLEKEVNIPKWRVRYYDPDEVELDEKGRKYFFNEDGYRTYFDDFDHIYDVRVDQNGIEEEYIVLEDGSILVFKNPEHTLAVDEYGNAYQYDPDRDEFLGSPQITFFEDRRR